MGEQMLCCCCCRAMQYFHHDCACGYMQNAEVAVHDSVSLLCSHGSMRPRIKCFAGVAAA